MTDADDRLQLKCWRRLAGLSVGRSHGSLHSLPAFDFSVFHCIFYQHYRVNVTAAAAANSFSLFVVHSSQTFIFILIFKSDHDTIVVGHQKKKKNNSSLMMWRWMMMKRKTKCEERIERWRRFNQSIQLKSSILKKRKFLKINKKKEIYKEGNESSCRHVVFDVFGSTGIKKNKQKEIKDQN